MNIRSQLEQRLSQALSASVGRTVPAMVTPAAKPEFGDYQANGIMPAAKPAKMNPRKLAEEVLAKADLADLAEKVEIAGPGFINIHLKKGFLAAAVNTLAADGRLGIQPPALPQKIVVDYSQPNLAKAMHVGHLRSTIIGDALVRVLEFLGHNVIRQNHVGDWGTQFGMLLAYMDRLGATGQSTDIADLEAFYRAAFKLFESDEEFARTAREYVVRLQAGDEHCLRNWRIFLDKSMRHCEEIYAKLGVKLTREDVRGESAYNDDLPNVITDLRQKGMLQESQGAQCVFLDEFKAKDGEPLPVIVQKSGGGYLYATTDLAAIRYRAGVLKANRVLYVVDARQALHFRQVFAVAAKAGFVPEGVSLEHIAFGTMLGPDGRPLRTRKPSEPQAGTASTTENEKQESVKLLDLLGEAETRATELVRQKDPELPEDQAARIGQVVGIGAVKYADLAQNRTSDYIFSYDKMLSLEGNTAPYMQYAYARVMSIFRKAGIDAAAAAGGTILLGEPAERNLALKLLQFAEVAQGVAELCLPNMLCAYLYDLASAFTTFYENCPVIQSAEPTRSSRLALCAATAAVIRIGLGLLGIQTVEQM